MGSDEDRKGIRIYRSARVRHWRLSFHPGDVHSLFDELIHRRWGRAKWQPNIDVLKTTTGYVVEVDLPCRPCSLHGTDRCREGDHRCMRMIRSEEVFGVVSDVLNGR